MKIKLFGLIWNLEPILWVLWFIPLGAAFFGVFGGMLAGNFAACMAGIIGGPLYLYITMTVISNKDSKQ